MQSPLKKILVFDFETGGLDYKTNPITEMAIVAIDVETLKIEEEFSIVFKPQFDLTHKLEESKKEAKRLFNNLATTSGDTKIKSLKYRGKEITLKSLDALVEDIEKFDEFLEERRASRKKMKLAENTINWEEYQELLKSTHSHIVEVYFNSAYNPQALEVTHISLDLLLNEGVDHSIAVEKVSEIIKRYTVGSYKPILAGHNIKGFDKDFFIKLFDDYGLDLSKVVNSFEIDTLEWVRLRWNEMSSYSLGVCANELGMTLKDAHRALPDTISNAKLLIKLLQSMRGEGQGLEKRKQRRKFDMKY